MSSKRARPSAGAAPAAPAKRAYNSARRQRQAAQTRAEVLSAAMRLFNERGWAGTTVADIAAEAGVALDTVYGGFGSKKALARDAYDASVVGDAAPVPFVERDEFLRMGRGSVADRIRAAITFLADTHARSAGVWRALHDAAEGDDELTRWVAKAEQRRRLDVRRSLERIFDRPVDGPMVDALWAFYGHDVYRTLVHDAGYSREAYQQCVAEVTLRLLGEDVTMLADHA